ncbi:MAG: SDR family NAD(P)-dependent oxidoreductase [Rhodospirillum sp.]|nr:SDR family NAD(P)-dependent oxidoreductase [Rhodospirillum sp.]MCF8492107.1 SDR family NAD(P)-dependent oxidoreductase [Rhodospirillum sp.]MCF8501155.1 SDR family NAD(P)-dependent oxidoreductase [Rhodospirillum sp.]
MKNPRRVLITGASSGLGAALARRYAAPGVSLILGARRLDLMEEVAASCRAKGANVSKTSIDVTDREVTRAWVLAADGEAFLDLVVANAGISAGSAGQGGESEDQARRILDVTVTGVLNTVEPILPRFLKRRRGQVALLSSLAGYRGYPGAPAYCASKAWVRVWGEATRLRLAPEGVEVNVVMPGFFRSAITEANDFPMPFLMGEDDAARRVARGLSANRGRIAFPWPTTFVAWVLAALPAALADPLLSRTPYKG